MTSCSQPIYEAGSCTSLVNHIDCG